MEIALTSKRCLCVHATLQMVDVVLKSVLFQRQFVPDVVARLLETNEKFADDYAKVADVLRDCFRSRNRELIQEVVIVVGPTCYAPREFFRIPIHVCQEEQDEPSTSGCGSRCGELTDREIMAFYRTMMTNFPVDDFKKLKRTDRAYIMLNAGESLQLSSFEDMSADESFSLPMANSVRKPPLLETTIKMSHECESPGGGQKTAAAKPSCWFRVVPHFKVIS